jgi:hypothetical protein
MMAELKQLMMVAKHGALIIISQQLNFTELLQTTLFHIESMLHNKIIQPSGYLIETKDGILMKMTGTKQLVEKVLISLLILKIMTLFMEAVMMVF